MKNNKFVLPELLAPAGDWETLKVGVAAGADAVYIGGKLFSARQYAPNFDHEELAKAADYLHLRGRKLYVTVNTLIKQEEIDGLLEYIDYLSQIGADAVILQDLGALYLVRTYWPHLPVHASTQMTVHDGAGVRFLQNLGVERVILSRELSWEEIKAIHEENSVQLEVFVHGALCVAYSGACLFSSLVGGRSGNRGRCAQPCRLTYTLYQNRKKGNPVLVSDREKHLLSPKDLALISALPQLITAGVSSLKIEGRMKGAEYVGSVVSTYRKALDRYAEDPAHFQVTPVEQKALATVFNRGFSSGYFLGDLGPDLISPDRPNNRGRYIGRVKAYDGKRKKCLVKLEENLAEGDGVEIWVKVGGRVGTIVEDLTVNGKKVEEAQAGTEAWFALPKPVKAGDRVFLTSSRLLSQKIQEMMRNDYPGGKLPCTLRVGVTPGEPLFLEMEGLDAKVTVRSAEKAQVATKRPLTEETLKNHLTRLGDTPFRAASFTATIEGEPMLPFSQLNQVRREAVVLLSEKILAAHRRPPHDFPVINREEDEAKTGYKRSGPSFLTVFAGNLDLLKVALASGVPKVIFGGESFTPGFRWTSEHLAEGMELARRSGARAVIALPRITREREKKRVIDALRTSHELRPDGLLISHLGSLQMVLAESELPVYANYPFHFFNSYTPKIFDRQRIKGFTLSPELTKGEILALVNHQEFDQIEVELIVFGALELMVSQFCPVGAWAGQKPPQTCPRPCRQGQYFLRDRKAIDFPVVVDDFCRMHLLNSKYLSLLREFPLLGEKRLSLRLELRHQNPELAAKVIRIFQTALAAGGSEEDQSALEAILDLGLTRGHFYRGVE
ncbi:MAG: U32 family peptidase [Firmicutes bacterium]|nr:U32 family peptidase [Bacillota bacterium]